MYEDDAGTLAGDPMAEETAPEEEAPPPFVQDAQMVAAEMRTILDKRFDGGIPASSWAAVTEQRINAAQVLLNATQAIEMWAQQERQFQIQAAMIRDQVARQHEAEQRAGLLMPVVPGLH